MASASWRSSRHSTAILGARCISSGLEVLFTSYMLSRRSRSGIVTPEKDIDLIYQRLAAAERDYREGRTNMKTKRKTAKSASVTEGGSNVFADLGLPNADQELMKARLTLQIYRIIKERGITQTEAGKILGIPQPHVSALARNRAGNFSVGRLIDFLTALGQDVEITVRPTRKDHGQMSVVVA